MRCPAGSYVGRRAYQVTFVHSHGRFMLVACPECLAPVGLDCMAAHPRKDYQSPGRYPVRPHRARKALR